MDLYSLGLLDTLRAYREGRATVQDYVASCSQRITALEPRITEGVYDVLTPAASAASRTSYGGTAPKNVRAQAKAWLKRLEKEQKSG
jgi:argininosuccinate lyase